MQKHIATWGSYTRTVVTWSQLLPAMRGICCWQPMAVGSIVVFSVQSNSFAEAFLAWFLCNRCLAVSPNFEIAKNNMAIALTDLGTKVITCTFSWHGNFIFVDELEVVVAVVFPLDSNSMQAS